MQVRQLTHCRLYSKPLMFLALETRTRPLARLLFVSALSATPGSNGFRPGCTGWGALCPGASSGARTATDGVGERTRG